MWRVQQWYFFCEREETESRRKSYQKFRVRMLVGGLNTDILRRI